MSLGLGFAGTVEVHVNNGGQRWDPPLDSLDTEVRFIWVLG